MKVGGDGIESALGAGPDDLTCSGELELQPDRGSVSRLGERELLHEEAGGAQVGGERSIGLLADVLVEKHLGANPGVVPAIVARLTV
jgi:hypothetical protein